MTTVTQWFKNGEKPKHAGLYEFRIKKEFFTEPGKIPILKWHWNGTHWPCNEGLTCFLNRYEWRGLAVKPKSGISSK